MKIRDYLREKYGVVRPTTMLHQEATVFGLRMVPGWLDELGDREITVNEAGVLYEWLRSSAVRAVNPDRRASAERGAAILSREFGFNETAPGTGREMESVKARRKRERRERRKERRAQKLAKRPTPTKNAPAPQSDAFLASYEWRRVRMVVLKRDGARCSCCGATAADGVRMHVDHIKPSKHFPELALDQKNLQVLCEVCNHGKGNWDRTDWREKGAVIDLEQWQKDHLRSLK